MGGRLAVYDWVPETDVLAGRVGGRDLAVLPGRALGGEVGQLDFRKQRRGRPSGAEAPRLLSRCFGTTEQLAEKKAEALQEALKASLSG